MQKNSTDFSMENARRMANSPLGQQLLAMLQESDNQRLQEATRQAQNGNFEDAKKALEPLLRSPQIQALLKQLGG